MGFLKKLVQNIGGAVAEAVADSIQNAFLDEEGAPPEEIIDINSIYSDGKVTYALDENMGMMSEKDKQQLAANKLHAMANVDVNEVKTAYSEQADDGIWMSSWDPRLQRRDYFLYTDQDKGIRVPFASDTIATLFADQVYSVEKAIAKKMIEKSSSGMEGWELQKHTSALSSKRQGNGNQESSSFGIVGGKQASGLDKLGDMDKIIATNLKDFRNEAILYGAQSLMNPYSLTRLMGSFEIRGQNDFMNYMYDIRDRRRFYDLGHPEANTNVHVPSNPSLTELINWSNADKWGRTPYSYQDFVFCKWFGLISNNRLLTLRRYHAPTYDNLNFDSMWGRQEQVTKTADGTNDPESAQPLPKSNTPQGTFSPICTVVSYFGGETQNSLSDIIGFSSGILWKQIESKIHDVSGEQGDSPQAVMDKMFESGGFGTAEFEPISKMMQGLSKVTSDIYSFGKFALGLNGRYGISEKLINHYNQALEDPFSGGPYENRIKGPMNIIKGVMAREQGITFDQQLTIKCTYQKKAIGGLNPKAVMLDILGNAMLMVSPQAVFWGGGHRYKITPHTYPFHDGGWRDSFMESIYKGHFLGKSGALAQIGSGLSKFAQDKDGNFSFDALTSSLGGGLSQLMGAIGEGLQSLASSVQIGGLGDLLGNAGDWMKDKADSTGGEDARKAGEEKYHNMAKNLKRMWHDKVMQATTLPHINGMGALLIGEPVGEWHLTVGNPLNPIMVCGNLICEKMQVQFNDELGPDDFPTEMTITYSLKHGMGRDRDGIQSMFNRGMGKFYCLPDYIKLSSDQETTVDRFTGKNNDRLGTPGEFQNDLNYLSFSVMNKLAKKDGVRSSGYSIGSSGGGMALSNTGNPDTTLVTNYTPLDVGRAQSIANMRSDNFSFVNSSNIPLVRSLAITRKFIGS